MPTTSEERERCGDDRELGAAESERAEEPEGRERRVPDEARAPRPRHERSVGETSSARGVGTRVEHLPDDVLGRDALHPQLRAEHQPVRERRDGDGLDVVREDEVAAAGARPDSGRA